MALDRRATSSSKAMAARREHSKGDGNFPLPRSRVVLPDEGPLDRIPRDVPKGRDDRSAPKGGTTAGQRDRNPRLEMRDDPEPELKGRRPASGFDRALAAADEANAARSAKQRPKRPTARRSTAAKRAIQRRRRAS